MDDEGMVYEPLMKLDYVASELQVHPMSCYRWAKMKKLPFFKVGAGWRMTRDSFDKLGSVQIERKQK